MLTVLTLVQSRHRLVTTPSPREANQSAHCKVQGFDPEKLGCKTCRVLEKRRKGNVALWVKRLNQPVKGGRMGCVWLCCVLCYSRCVIQHLAVLGRII